MKDSAAIDIAQAYVNDNKAANFCGSTPATMKWWRHLSRRAGRLIGPPWIEIKNGKKPKIVYKISDLDAWLEANRTPLKPNPPRGRPRKPVIQQNKTAAANPL